MIYGAPPPMPAFVDGGITSTSTNDLLPPPPPPPPTTRRPILPQPLLIAASDSAVPAPGPLSPSPRPDRRDRSESSSRNSAGDTSNATTSTLQSPSASSLDEDGSKRVSLAGRFAIPFKLWGSTPQDPLPPATTRPTTFADDEFPAYLPEVMQVSIKINNKAKVKDAELVMVKINKQDCLVYLIPGSILVCSNIPGAELQRFSLPELKASNESQAKPASASSKEKMVIKLRNYATGYSLALRPSTNSATGEADFLAWDAAVTVALSWQKNRHPRNLPSTRFDDLQSSISTYLNGPKPEAAKFRHLWHDYLVNPHRRKAMHRLLEGPFQAILSQNDKEQAFRSVLQLLTCMEDNTGVRCVLFGTDIKASVINQVAKPPPPAMAAGHGGDDRMYSEIPAAVGSAEPAQAASRFVDILDKLAKDASMANPDWLARVSALLGFSRGLTYVDAEYDFLERIEKKVQTLLPLSSYSDLRSLRSVTEFQFFVASRWVQHDKKQKEFLELLQQSESEILEMQEDPKATTAPTAQRSLAELVVYLDVDHQKEAFDILAQQQALHRVFQVVVQAYVDLHKLDRLRLVTQKCVRPGLVPDAPKIFLDLLLAQGKSKDEDEMDLVLEMLCTVLGSQDDAYLALAGMDSPAPEQVKALEDSLMHFASKHLKELTRKNAVWFDEDQGGKDLKKQRLQQADVDTIDLDRWEDEIVSVIAGFIRLCGWPGLRYLDAIRKWAKHVESVFRKCLVPKVRDAAAEVMRELEPEIMPAVVSGISDGTLMNQPSFFSEKLLQAVSNSAPGYAVLGEDMYLKLLAVADKLDQYDSFDLSILVQQRKSNTVKKILKALCSEIVQRPDKELFSADVKVTIADLVQSAVAGFDAIMKLDDTRSQRMLEEIINHYVKGCTPTSWLALFKKLDAIAFFIKYLRKESYELAWRVFYNNNSEQRWVSSLLDECQSQFNVPIVELDQLNTTSDALEEELFADIEARTATEATVEMQFICRFTLAWMRRMQKLVNNKLLLPHNTQIICTLLFANFYLARTKQQYFAGADEVRHFKSLIAEVGTGEGKSVIIVMMALYFVTVHGCRVHVLENNSSLRNRDFNNYKDFYGSFKNCKNAAVTTSTSVSEFADVTYCLQEEVDTLHLKEAPKGKNAFDGVILIVDEVDDLIVDRQQSTGYILEDDDYTEYAEPCFAQLKAYGKNATKPADCPDKVWNEVRKAWAEVTEWKENIDYAYDGTQFRLRDKVRGRIKSNTITTELQYLNYVRGYNNNPSIYSTYYVISTPHIFNQYSFILGLTGTVGGPAERAYLEKTYKAGVFAVPPFLTTCNVPEIKDKLLWSLTTVESSAAAQRQRVVDLAIEKSKLVPVLIITEPSQVQRYFKALADRRLPGQDPVQRLLEYDNGVYKEDKWETIIDKATQPVPDIKPQTWRVTVTDYFGGRGHDYRVGVRSEDVNDNGGMLVIITHIPDSQREWVQWKGRTARQDCRGQVAVVLDESETEFLAQHSDLVQKFRAGDLTATKFIEALLDKRNTAKAKKLEADEASQHKGMVVAELCDRFYRNYGPAEPWPDSPEKRQLRDFLEEYGHHPPVAEIMKLAESLDLDQNFPY